MLLLAYHGMLLIAGELAYSLLLALPCRLARAS
jgi:hypothetical protein